MSDRKLLPGKFVWFEHVSRDARKAQAFYGEVLGWKTQGFPMGEATYEMVYLGDTMIGGYAAPSGAGERSQWLACVSVEDVDAAARAATAGGGKVIEPPLETAGIGCRARIADPQGAEIYLWKSATGDPPDAPPPVGAWLWNELHTTDPTAACAFYEKVVGFSHKAMDMGPAGKYHILCRGSVDRGGITGMLTPGTPPHWLPYVEVADADATIARARKHGAKIQLEPHDIPDIGRFGIFEDPAGATLAVMKSAPMTRRQ